MQLATGHGLDTSGARAAVGGAVGARRDSCECGGGCDARRGGRRPSGSMSAAVGRNLALSLRCALGVVEEGEELVALHPVWGGDAGGGLLDVLLELARDDHEEALDFLLAQIQRGGRLLAPAQGR